MQSLKLRPEFLTKYMQATAIELCNQQNSGWAQRTDPTELLDMTYPTADVQRALERGVHGGRRLPGCLHRSAWPRQVAYHGSAASCFL